MSRTLIVIISPNHHQVEFDDAVYEINHSLLGVAKLDGEPLGVFARWDVAYYVEDETT